MVEGGTSGSGVQWGSSTSSHSSSSSSSSKGRDTRLLIRVSPLVQSERIHSFFDRSLAMAKPPIGCGFVKKVSRKSEDTVIVSIEDASIARRLVSSFSESRPKIDGHDFTIELYSSDHSKSLSSPSNHNGDKRREKESTRMSSCSSQPSPSTASTSKRPSHASPSTSRPSTSTQESTRIECAPSSSSSSHSMTVDPYDGIVGAAMKKLPLMGESIIREMIHAGLRETIGGYLNHYNEDSGRAKVLLKRHSQIEEIPAEGSLLMQGEQTTFSVLPTEETRKLYDKYLSSEKCRESMPSTSSAPSPSPCHSSSGPRDAMSYLSSRTIFVPCLRKGTTRESLRRRFDRLGAVLEVEVKNGQSKAPHAIVQFAHTQGAVMAMDDYEKEQRESRKCPHFVPSVSSLRVWVANLPPQDEDYVKKKLQDLLKGSQNPTIVVDSRRREGIIDFTSLEKAKHYLEMIKSSPLVQQSGQVQTWLVADYCSDLLYDHFIQRRSQSPSEQEKEFISALSKMLPNPEQREQADARMKRMKGGEEKAMEKKRSINGENGNHLHSPSSSRRLNGEDRRSGDSGFSEDREKAQALDSDDDEMLERKWRTLAPANDRREENGVMKRRICRLGDDLAGFIPHVPVGIKTVKKEIKEEEEGEKKENEKIPREQRVNGFRDALLNVGTPLKARGIDDILRYRGKDPLKSPPIPISPFNGDKEKKHIVSSPPSGSRPAPLHISIPQSSSTHSNAVHSPYSRVPPSSSTSSSRHPSISTPSTLTPRSHTLPSSAPRPPFPIESNGDHVWSSGGTGAGSTIGTPTSSRLPLSRRESVCSNSSQSTPLPPITPSTSGATGTVYTPNALKSPPLNSWSSTPNAWKGGPSLSSPNPSSINRSRPSLDHKTSTPSSHSRPPLALPKSSMDKPGLGLGPSSSLPKIPSLPRSTSMNEKKPIISRESSKDIVNNIIQNKSGHLKNMQRIPKKDNRERDEKEERREKKREEKDRERKEDREERKEKKEDRKKSRENETKEEKARRKELKRKERDKEERKKSSTDKEKKRKSIDVEKKKKKKHSRTRSESEDSEMESDPCSRQIDSDAAIARKLAQSFGGSMYDRVKVRRSGGGKEEKKSAALETLRMKNKKKTSKKRVHLSSSSESDGEVKESGKKMKREEGEESSDEEEEERERRKKEKKREKERRETTDESESEEEMEKKRTKEKKVLKKNSTLDLFSDDADSVKSERKEPLSKKRSHDKEEKGRSPSPCSSSHPPPGKKVKKEESSSSQSESEDEAERSSKKSEVSTSSWRAGEDKSRRLSESSVATHSEKDEAWKSPSSGSVDKEIKEEPKEDRPPPRLMTKAAMKEFNVGASSSPAGASWMSSKDDTGLNLSSDSSQSSSDSEDEKEDTEERKEEEEKKEEKMEEKMEEESEDRRVDEEKVEEEKMEEESVEMKEEETIEETIEEKKEEEERMEEDKEEEEVKKEVEESQPLEKDEEAESAVRGLESPSDDVIEETEKAVESIFDEEEEPEARYPSNDFLNASDMILSSSSSQCSSPKIPSSSSLPHRPTPLHPSAISSPSILSPSPLHHHLLQSHSIPPPVSSPLISSPLISSPLISPSTSRPASIHLNVRPISQESSSHHVHDENGGTIHHEKAWTPQGSSSDGPSPSPNHHPMMNKDEIIKKFPVKWSGPMKMKNSEMQTLWYKLHGDDGLLNSVLAASSTIAVVGKMRMNNEKVGQLICSMENGEEHACLIVTPAGHSPEELLRNRETFSKSLVGYFQNKGIAGIIDSVNEGQRYLGHCFAPGDFVRDYLVPLYPDFHDLLNTKYPNAFLLVILKRADDE